MITAIPSLRTWFLDQKKPYWVLNNNGVSRSIIARNEAIEDIDQAWNLLETNIMAQAEGGIANLRVFVTDKPKHNHGLETEIRIVPGYAQPSAGQVAGIGSLPAGYLDEAKVAGMLADAEARWEMKREIADLRAQLDAPVDWTDKFVAGFERISQTPVGQILVAKMLGVTPAPPAPQRMAAAPMNGTNDTDDDGEGDYDDKFFDDIERTAALLGVDEKTLAAKLALLAAQNPDIAKSLLA